jgi:hypothetical protein
MICCSLMSSGTTEPGVYSYFYNSKTIRLIDTPGFDDTNRSDTDILKDIAFFLSTIYSKKVKLAGIIYLHRITDNRMTGTSNKNLRMLEKICGDSAMSKIVLVTTMWNLLGRPGSDHTLEVGEQREAMLRDKFWGNVERKGGSIARHYGDAASGQAIISQLFENERAVALDIQREMIDQGLSLDQTTAGRFLQEDQIKAREKHERDLEDAQEALEDAIKEKDKALITQFSQQTTEYKAKLEKADADTSALSVNFSSLVQEKDAQYATLARDMEAEKKSRADEMRFIEQNLADLQDTLEWQEKDHKSEMRRLMRSQSAKTAAETARMQMLAEQYERRHADMIAQIAAAEDEKRRKAARDKRNIFKGAFWVTLFEGGFGGDDEIYGREMHGQMQHPRPIRHGSGGGYHRHGGGPQNRY